MYYKKVMHYPKKQKVHIGIVVAMLFFIFAIFYFSANSQNPISSVEVGFTSLSPAGYSGGFVIPASCPSFAHFPGECDAWPTCNPCSSAPNACGQTNTGQNCGSGCDAVTPPNPSGYGNSCTSSPNACGQADFGIIDCGGNCSATTPANPPWYGNSCTSSPNACGQTNFGTTDCGGNCSATMPANPSGYGNPCNSSPNSCGMRNSGSIQCNGVCSATTPPDSLCGIPCSPLLGNACTSPPSACGQVNFGSIQCDGSCSATTPANPPGYGNPCNSSPNSCGMRNSGSIQCNGVCSATTPPDSLCGGNQSPVVLTGMPHALTVNSLHSHSGASVIDDTNNSGKYTWSWVSTPAGFIRTALSTNISILLSPIKVFISGPSYTPTVAGIYTTRLTVTDSGGLSGSANLAEITSSFLPGNFTLNPPSAACSSVSLSWTTSTGANAYRILKGAARVDISPYQPYTALNFVDFAVSENTTYLYQIEAYNGAGPNRSNARTVITPYCPPTLNFSGNPTSIYQGQSTTLTWSTSFATSCIASGAWSGSKAVNNSEIVIPSPPPSVTYTLTCAGPGGSSGPRSAVINIAPFALPEWKEIIPR